MDWNEATDSQIVCYCQNINKGTIVDAIKSGNNTLAKIKDSTTACTGGNCKDMNPSGNCCSGDILELIKLYSEESNESSSSSCCCCSNS